MSVYTEAKAQAEDVNVRGADAAGCLVPWNSSTTGKVGRMAGIANFGGKRALPFGSKKKAKRGAAMKVVKAAAAKKAVKSST